MVFQPSPIAYNTPSSVAIYSLLGINAAPETPILPIMLGRYGNWARFSFIAPEQGAVFSAFAGVMEPHAAIGEHACHAGETEKGCVGPFHITARFERDRIVEKNLLDTGIRTVIYPDSDAMFPEGRNYCSKMHAL